MTVYEILNKIQTELKAPKNQRNNFGNYNFRSLEGILEAVKPLLNGAIVTINDEMVFIGERYYIKATITITYDGLSISDSAYAREAESQKGMNLSQLTGSTSSYARKYSANGLFLIDDTKDADTDEHHQQVDRPEKKPTFDRQKEIDSISELVKTKSLTDTDKEQIKSDIRHAKTKKDFETIYASVEGI